VVILTLLGLELGANRFALLFAGDVGSGLVLGLANRRPL
jgi:hypothetical protein